MAKLYTNDMMFTVGKDEGITATIDVNLTDMDSDIKALLGLPSTDYRAYYRPDLNGPRLYVGDGIKKVIFNDPATIVLWNDGTKTVVKATGETFDKEKGLAMAICKRMMSNKGNYYNIFRQYCGEESNDPCSKAERKLELQGDESVIEILSEMRRWFSCFDEKEGLAYDALSLAIRAIKANSNVARRETNNGKD